jgi:hypothetical protein
VVLPSEWVGVGRRDWIAVGFKLAIKACNSVLLSAAAPAVGVYDTGAESAGISVGV